MKKRREIWDTSNHADAVFHDGLACYLKSFEYDFKRRSALLKLGGVSCTCMSAAVDLARAIDPEVVSVVTLCDQEPKMSTLYYLADGRWKSLRTNDKEVILRVCTAALHNAPTRRKVDFNDAEIGLGYFDEDGNKCKAAPISEAYLSRLPR